MQTSTKPQWIRIISMLLIISVSLSATAAPKKEKKKKQEKTAQTKPAEQDAEYLALIADLKSADPEKIIFAVQMLGATGNPDAATHLIALLKTGPRNDITNMAIETLGALANEDSIDTLLQYLNHRRSDARVAAIFALEGFSSPKIKSALELKLRDSDPQVRSNAALALSTKGDAESVPLLFLAFDRGVNDAAVTIGKLGNAKDAIRLTEYLGRLDVTLLLPGFKEFILGANIDEGTKLEILNILFDLAGPDVRQFAVQIRAKLNAENPNIDAAENAIMRMLNKMINQIAQE
ncbi:MAG: HEAT repeat domain-containing protein [Deltaproteobacteria bacterium]|nr:HEAT repeat domain-containing protein [Deltaproteobacteria bacterium]MBN2671244.1 HEAT repeat domain-containing protein [Deltaproteobacteria bacterium]